MEKMNRGFLTPRAVGLFLACQSVLACGPHNSAEFESTASVASEVKGDRRGKQAAAAAASPSPAPEMAAEDIAALLVEIATQARAEKLLIQATPEVLRTNVAASKIDRDRLRHAAQHLPEFFYSRAAKRFKGDKWATRELFRTDAQGDELRRMFIDLAYVTPDLLLSFANAEVLELAVLSSTEAFRAASKGERDRQLAEQLTKIFLFVDEALTFRTAMVPSDRSRLEEGAWGVIDGRMFTRQTIDRVYIAALGASLLPRLQIALPGGAIEQRRLLTPHRKSMGDIVALLAPAEIEATKFREFGDDEKRLFRARCHASTLYWGAVIHDPSKTEMLADVSARLDSHFAVTLQGGSALKAPLRGIMLAQIATLSCAESAIAQTEGPLPSIGVCTRLVDLFEILDAKARGLSAPAADVPDMTADSLWAAEAISDFDRSEGEWLLTRYRATPAATPRSLHELKRQVEALRARKAQLDAAAKAAADQQEATRAETERSLIADERLERAERARTREDARAAERAEEAAHKARDDARKARREMHLQQESTLFQRTVFSSTVPAQPDAPPPAWKYSQDQAMLAIAQNDFGAAVFFYEQSILALQQASHGLDQLRVYLGAAECYLMHYKYLMSVQKMAPIVESMRSEIETWEASQRWTGPFEELDDRLWALDTLATDLANVYPLQRALELYRIAGGYPQTLWTQLPGLDMILESHAMLLDSPAQFDEWNRVATKWWRFRGEFIGSARKAREAKEGKRRYQGEPQEKRDLPVLDSLSYTAQIAEELDGLRATRRSMMEGVAHPPASTHETAAAAAADPSTQEQSAAPRAIQPMLTPGNKD